MRILITGAGGAAAISAWKSLHQEHELFMADIDACASGLYLVPATQRLLIPKGHDAHFVTVLLKICKEKKIEVLLATVDTELAPLAKQTQQFTENNIHLPLSPYETLKLCYDKYLFLQACQNVIPTPDFILLNKENISSINNFPRFVKPRIGAGSRGAEVIANRDALNHVPTDNSYLVQELLPGDEYSVDVYISSQGQAIAAVPRLRMKTDSGIAVTARTQHIPELSEHALKIAQHVGIRYAANIQFKRSTTQEFKILEINPRFSGTLPLTTAAGVDIPKLIIRDLKGETFSQQLMKFNELMVVRYWTEHFFPVSEWQELCEGRKNE